VGKWWVQPQTASMRFNMACSKAISSVGTNPLHCMCAVLCSRFRIRLVLCTEIFAHDDDTVGIIDGDKVGRAVVGRIGVGRSVGTAVGDGVVGGWVLVVAFISASVVGICVGRRVATTVTVRLVRVTDNLDVTDEGCCSFEIDCSRTVVPTPVTNNTMPSIAITRLPRRLFLLP